MVLAYYNETQDDPSRHQWNEKSAMPLLESMNAYKHYEIYSHHGGKRMHSILLDAIMRPFAFSDYEENIYP